jgi:hypothetical protein
LQNLAKRKQLNTIYIDAWNINWPENAGAEYAKKAKLKLEKEGEVEDDVFETLAEATGRTVWGKGANSKVFKLSKGQTMHRTTDKKCPYQKEWVKTEASKLVTTVLGDEFSETDVRKWVSKADGKNSSFYFVVHNEEIVGFLFHEKADFPGYDVDLIRGYGVADRLKKKGVGSALIHACFENLPNAPYICADIDSLHPDSLNCITRAAPLFGRKAVALGRIVMNAKKKCILEWNRHPRPGTLESKEWCCMLNTAPDFAEREDEKYWPAVDEEDVPATKGGEDKQAGGKRERKTASGNLGGRPRKAPQFVKKSAKNQEEEKKKEEMKKKEEKKSSKQSKKNKKSEGVGKKSKSKKETKGGK